MDRNCRKKESESYVDWCGNLHICIYLERERERERDREREIGGEHRSIEKRRLGVQKREKVKII